MDQREPQRVTLAVTLKDDRLGNIAGMDWTVFSKKRGTLTRKLTAKMAVMVERVQRRSMSGLTWNGYDTAR